MRAHSSPPEPADSFSRYTMRLTVLAAAFAFLLPPPGDTPLLFRLALVALLVWTCGTAAHSRRRAAQAYADGYAAGRKDEFHEVVGPDAARVVVDLNRRR